MIIELVRERGTNKSTPGTLLINKKHFCFTIEDIERPEAENDPSNKVFGLTAIPRKKYKVIVNYSNHFKRDMILFLDVPNFTGVRLHSGNTAVDSHGCIVVGRNRLSLDKIQGDSKNLEEEITQIVADTIADGEEVFFDITHVDDKGMTLPNVNV